MKKPNILLIVLDATRAEACSCYGWPASTTPALDKLATEGTLFEQAIAAAPWTLPAMSTILTGLYASQIEIHQHRALLPEYRTLPEILSDNGYATFGITNNSWLSADFGLQRGFGVMHKQWQFFQTSRDINSLVLMHQSGHQGWKRSIAGQISRGNVLKNIVNTAYTRTFAYRGDLGASRMLSPFRKWVMSQEKPWFAMVHYLEAHLPYRPPKKWLEQWTHDKEKAWEIARSDQWRPAWRHMAGVEKISESLLTTWRELYLAEIAYADYQLGQLVQWLKANSQLENTFVIVTADHGELVGEHDMFEHQHALFDLLIHVPLIIRFPNYVPPGKRISDQVQTLDIFMTILKAAGIEAESTASRNLLSDSVGRAYTVSEYGMPRPRHERVLTRYGLTREQIKHLEKGLVAIRTDDYKLILGTDGGVELYDLESDRQENDNIAEMRPEIVKSLRDLLVSWRKKHSISDKVQGPLAEQKIDPAVEARLQSLGYID